MNQTEALGETGLSNIYKPLKQLRQTCACGRHLQHWSLSTSLCQQHFWINEPCTADFMFTKKTEDHHEEAEVSHTCFIYWFLNEVYLAVYLSYVFLKWSRFWFLLHVFMISSSSRKPSLERRQGVSSVFIQNNSSESSSASSSPDSFSSSFASTIHFCTVTKLRAPLQLFAVTQNPSSATDLWPL